MFRFENIEMLYALFLVPLFLLLFIARLAWKKKAIKRFGDPKLVELLMPNKSNGKIILKFVFLSLALISLIVALANPQIGSKLEEAKRSGVDLMIVLDVSNSMLAEDIKPNRLERAKQSISKLLTKLKGDRIGIVIFAGESFLQLPITNDYAAAKLYLQSISTKSVASQGTAIGDALNRAITTFPKSAKKNRAIILITDGENHEDDAIDAVKSAVEQGIVVFTLGMGTPPGAPIPAFNNNVKSGYKKDRNNNTIISKLNEGMLSELAKLGNGKFIQASNSNVGLDYLFSEINNLEKMEFSSKMITDYEDRYQYFVALALLFLLIDFFIHEKKNKLVNRIKLFSTK
jgi:Ca-activated chloride channel family protein